jgi:hypothetical protein
MVATSTAFNDWLSGEGGGGWDDETTGLEDTEESVEVRRYVALEVCCCC